MAALISILSGIGSLQLRAQLNFDFIAGRSLMKGQVIDLQTKRPLPLANILITNKGKGISCDIEGYFTMYVSKSDTLKFSCVGYVTKEIHVSDIDSTNFCTLKVELLQDFIHLKGVIIYPYRDLNDFKRAFIEARNTKQVLGIAPPKYNYTTSRPKFYNPISYLYDRIKQRSSANPDFKP